MGSTGTNEQSCKDTKRGSLWGATLHYTEGVTLLLEEIDKNHAFRANAFGIQAVKIKIVTYAHNGL